MLHIGPGPPQILSGWHPKDLAGRIMPKIVPGLDEGIPSRGTLFRHALQDRASDCLGRSVPNAQKSRTLGANKAQNEPNGFHFCALGTSPHDEKVAA